MSGVCLDCPGDSGCCYTLTRAFKDEDRRTFREWCYEVGFDVVMWSLLTSVVIGVTGLCFYAGVWGFINGIALLR